MFDTHPGPLAIALLCGCLLGAEAGEVHVEDDSAVEAIDIEDSLDDAVPERGWSLGGDLRVLYSYLEEDARDGSSFNTNDLIGRYRIEGAWAFTRRLRAGARLAGSCTDDDCSADFELDSSIPGTTFERGKATLDELFFHFFPSERFDLAIGRLQTRSVLRAGVFSKSLDRADSDNANINWTDGLHGTWLHRSGWESHLILQHNSAGGAGNVRRGPLDFRDDGSRITYFVAIENLEPKGPLVQRGVDVSYLPKSLLKDGASDGRVEDYWGIVARTAASWPQRTDRMRLRVGAEVGYAPETPTEAAVEMGGVGDADGLAWNVAASLMDFHRGHDIGFHYGRVGAGWLLSPDFGDNEEQIEIRYRWAPREDLLLELRARSREDLDARVSADRKRDRLDLFARLTWRFSVKEM